ncbi:helix-turn-helix domain-containing protein [Thalassospira marina]|uniref:PucR family transcriptional regulator n=1 Tax=Thalassospira marina TaxID=2048283 RepID=A0ABM6QHQ6_9PROT|nr:helix-turn-helix domain-containing protein [Thalassospira marina]AUG55951.1 PucR family transcriptional regulator [Thalassospira marina]
MDQTSRILSLRDVASQINSGGDLETILHQLIAGACRHAHWALGSIMAIDAAHGYAHVLARYDPTLLQRPLPNKWELAMSPSLIALQRNEPVYIRDARESEEFPGYRKEAFERDYRTVLVMPMNCEDFEGRPMVLSVIARQVTEVSELDLAFLGMITHLGTIAVEREHRFHAARQSAESLQQVLGAHSTLLRHVLSDGSVYSLSKMLADMVPAPLVVVDFTTNQVIAGKSPARTEYDDDAWQKAASSTLAPQLLKFSREQTEHADDEKTSLFLRDDRHHLTLPVQVAALIVDQQTVGALVIFSDQPAFTDLEKLLLESGCFALSVQMMRSVIRFRSETRTRAELFFDVVEARWKKADDVYQRAQRLGLDFKNAQQLVVIDFPKNEASYDGDTVDVERVVSRITQQQSINAGMVAIEGGFVCLIPEQAGLGREKLAKLTKRIADDLAHHFDEAPLVLASETCSSLGDYPAIWERCGRMIRIARSFGSTGAISSDGFGPLPMLVAASDAQDVKSFVHESIGEIARHDRENGTPYLETLSMFLREGCRNQACADTMGLHVTTLRYRLTRMQELFGIDLETANSRFAIELAIRLYDVMHNSRN